MMSYQEQDDFRVAVKAELARRRMTLGKLGESIGRNRTAVTIAVNRGMYEGTQRRIDEFLKLNFFKKIEAQEVLAK